MSFPRYPKYKPSGVEWLGEVPEHWEVKRLKSLLIEPLCYGANEASDCDTVGWPRFVRITDIDDAGGLRNETFRSLPPEVAAPFLLQQGDVLLARSGATVGKSFIYSPTWGTACFAGYLIRARLDTSRCLAEWFYSFCQTVAYWAHVLGTQIQTTIQNVSAERYASLVVPVPPLREQQAIAAFLDRETAKIDGLVEEQRRLIDLLKEKRQAVISHAVTKGLDPKAPMKPSGVEWLGEVPAHWEVRRLKTIVRSIEQGWSPQCEGEPATSDEDWAVLKVGCANGGVFRPDENKRLPSSLEPLPELAVRRGDLLVSRANTRELLGSAAVAPRDYPRLLICDKLYRLRLVAELANPQFVCRFLCSSAARSQIEIGATGASVSMLNIGQSILLELHVPTPSIEEQGQIVEELESRSAAFDSLVSEAASAITLLTERRSALISAAVTGQIDVRNVVATEAA